MDDDKLRELIRLGLENAHKGWATFACSDPQGDVCDAGFADRLTPWLLDENPSCPGCGGPSLLVELLEPVAR